MDVVDIIMDINFSETVGAFLLFGILLMSTFFPFIIIRSLNGRKQQRKAGFCSTLPLFSLGNCLASGVFLATCFVGLVPHVRQHVLVYQLGKTTTLHLAHDQVPWTEVLLMCGFLLSMLVEELFRLMNQANWFHKAAPKKCDSHQVKVNGVAPKKRCQSSFLSDEHEMVNTRPENEPLVEEPLQECTDSNFGSSDSQAGSPLPLKHGVSSFHDEANESGHCHDLVTTALKEANGKALNWRTMALLLSLSVHGVFEGVALGLQETAPAFWRLWLGVLTHEVLCAAAFGVQLASFNIPVWPAASCTLVLSSTVPWGMLGSFVMRGYGGGVGARARIVLQGLAAGTFVYVALFDMLHRELSIQGQQRWRLCKIVCVFVGFFTFFFITVYL